ncbi:hypothetical protein QA648_27370 (plasmid) [Rhizobium sp. CB3171]|uniref:hypothetical protein n=1 Tax=Rhizobium sp. CB3171 TaxID=3039157 RepID=UPI0024B111DE|nr:hypothetical protein [Rhizobium sp. CB3171]WFU04505.1 hypothetical protein QA648_27370 [Rhizobium sp. CB3171]
MNKTTDPSSAKSKTEVAYSKFKVMCARWISLIACFIGASIWLAIALGVAMPDKWFTSNFSDVSLEFLSDRHYLLIAFLLFVDLGIDIVVLGHEPLARTMMTKMGFLSLFLVVAAMVIPAAAGIDDAHFLNERHVLVFEIEIILLVAFKFLMYKASHPRLGNHQVQQKLTAVRVETLNTEG